MPDGRQPLAEPPVSPLAAEDVAFSRVQTVRSKGGLPGPGKSPWLLGLRGPGAVSLLRHHDAGFSLHLETTRRMDTLQWSDGTVPPGNEGYLANALLSR
jgi:hypothetical protein